ncbi:polyprenyl synthetase family protein [Paenibacillus sp. N3.4]|uniref:polyprenyl synthetase family protein n=1 Tax=Paenibacillus sp. N3.4 TaxID=2603222 RepID=UPI0011C86878|nr:polyprenyl synthetase family protein [Paenibacillus sp. N3.4]TXK73499.1 hypothetical protein FU659_30600 [Paenibacillus sp. N3.4]
MDQRILDEIDRIIDAYFHVSDLNSLLKQFVRDKANEGGRVWSDFTITIHHTLGGHSPLLYERAALTELLILALDIVDDLQDQDNGEKPWMTCDPAFALNAVIAFLVAAMGELSKSNRVHTPKLLQLITQSINGQQRDISNAVQTENDYILMVQEKSASLINMAFCMGYLDIDDCSSAIIDQIDELAQYIGITSQLENDTRDVQRIDQKNDLLQKKKTLPILFLLKQSEEKFPPLLHYFEGKISRDDMILLKPECLAFIEQSGCIEYARTIQYLFADKAEQIIDSLPIQSSWKDRLKTTLGVANS